MVTDGAFGGPSERLAEFNSARAPTYQYVFGYRSNVTYDGILEGTDWMSEYILLTLKQNGARKY